MKIHEIFKSIQGEGIDIGMPTIFVRFTGCNLNCFWCDTTYASRSKSKYKEMTVGKILKKIDDLGKVKNITLTGGEPFMQDATELNALIYNLKGLGYYINIETNGVFLPSLKHLKLVDRFSISPKLPSSGNNMENAINHKTLNKYIKNYSHKMFLKFVITNKNDFNVMLTILSSLKDLEVKNIPIVVQPNIDNTTVKSVAKQKTKFLELLDLVTKDFEEYSQKYSIRVIPQFHKILWSNKKGV